MELYINEVIKKLKEYYPEADILHNQVMKNNGIIKDGITIKQNGESIAPVIYISAKDMIEKSAEEKAEEIKGIYESSKDSEINFDPADFSDYEYIKSHVIFNLVNAETNKDDEKPSVMITKDIKAVFAVRIGEGMSIPIKNEHLKIWGNPAIDELFTYAVENSQRLDKAIFSSMESMLFGMHERFAADEDISDMIDEAKTDGMGMYILTSREQRASTILYPDVMQTIYDNLGSFYILPSSTHETIIIPVSADVDINQLKDMVKEVNQTVVMQDDPTEFLSDEVMIFDGSTLHEIDADIYKDEQR